MGLTNRERLQAGIRDLQAEMRRLTNELGPLRLEGPGKDRETLRMAAVPSGRLRGIQKAKKGSDFLNY